VDGQPGFISFELLRPVSGETRYFVLTHWEDEGVVPGLAHRPGDRGARRRARPPGRRGCGHGHGQGPVSTGASLLEFEVVQFSEAKKSSD